MNFDKSSYIKVKTLTVIEACNHILTKIIRYRESAWEAEVIERTKPYSYFFGLIKGAKTREEAEREMSTSTSGDCGWISFKTENNWSYRKEEQKAQHLLSACELAHDDFIYLNEEDADMVRAASKDWNTIDE